MNLQILKFYKQFDNHLLKMTDGDFCYHLVWDMHMDNGLSCDRIGWFLYLNFYLLLFLISKYDKL
jgi:hypothetical protein